MAFDIPPQCVLIWQELSEAAQWVSDTCGTSDQWSQVVSQVAESGITKAELLATAALSVVDASELLGDQTINTLRRKGMAGLLHTEAKQGSSRMMNCRCSSSPSSSSPSLS